MSCMTLSWRPSDVIVSTSFINSSICCLLTPLLPVSYSIPRAPPVNWVCFDFRFRLSGLFVSGDQSKLVQVRSAKEEPFRFEIFTGRMPFCHPTNSVNTMMTLLFEVTSCAGVRHNMHHLLWPWPFDLESGVRVTCDVGYLCANFNLPVVLSVLDLAPKYATDRRQTSDAHHRLMPRLWGRA